MYYSAAPVGIKLGIFMFYCTAASITATTTVGIHITVLYLLHQTPIDQFFFGGGG